MLEKRPLGAALAAYVCLVAFVFCFVSFGRAQSSAGDVHAQWNALADDFLDNAYLKFQPTQATVLGLHQYDSQLEDYSRQGIDREVAVFRTFEQRVSSFNADGLTQAQSGDREMVLGNIRGTLLDLQEIRQWQTNPDFYPSNLTQAAYYLMNRRFAPPDDRLRSVVAREKLMLPDLRAARTNLKNPAKISTQIALEDLPGEISFFKNDLPSAFADAKDPQVKADFAKSNAAMVAALESYERWLKTVELPQSKGDFAIGADVYSKKLLYDEMVDTPLDNLIAVDTENMRANQAEFARIAKELDPDKTTTDVLRELQHDHTTPDKLLKTMANTFDGLIGFIQSHHIVTIPSDVRPVLEETPSFMRATTSASLDPPGAFEKVATTAYFNVTLPDAKASPKDVEELMGEFNVGTVISTSVHEVYPGHYIHFLYLQKQEDRTRKIIYANTFVEGWAHYCEQMMLDEGYGQPGQGAKDARQAKLIRLGQLQDALLRNARFIVGIQMHRHQMTFDHAVAFFVKEGYQPRAVGEVEAKRGTSDPTYLYYTLGKLQILKLRADMQKKQGANFSLEKFHDEFLSQGAPPIKLVRQAMLSDDSPTL